MKYYTVESKSDRVTLKRTDVPEPSMLMMRRLFEETDGVPLEITYTHTISDRPFQRSATEEEIASGQYTANDYVQTTAADGIM